MNLTDKALSNLVQQKNQTTSSKITIEELTGFILNKMHLGSISLNTNTLQNIQFLSLQSNFLSEINFIKNLPNLFYLDVSKNTIEDLQIFNIKSSFGYLHFTLGQLYEKKLLMLKGMTVAILDIDIQDTSLFKQFLTNNPNIILLNQDIVYFAEKFLVKEYSRDSKKLKSLTMNQTVRQRESSLALLKFDFGTTNGNDNLPSLDLNSTDRIENAENLIPSINSNVIRNVELYKFVSFFIDYNKTLQSVLTNQNGPLTFNYVSLDKTYNDIEKMKLKMLCSIYVHIDSQINLKSTFLIYKTPMIRLSLFDFSKLIVDDIQRQMIILDTLLLYIIQMIPKELALGIFNYILKNFYNASNDELLVQESLSCSHLLSIYYYMYDIFLEKYTKKREQSLSDNTIPSSNYDRYENIIDHLKVDCLILKGNYLNELKKKTEENHDSHKKDSINHIQLKRPSVKWKISILKELKMNDTILPIIQFLSDFLYSNKIDKVLSRINPEYYIPLNELKEYLYQLSSEKLCFTLSDKKYEQNKLSQINNRYYLSKDNEHKDKGKEDNNLKTNEFELYTGEKHNHRQKSIATNHIISSSIFDNLHTSKRTKRHHLAILTDDGENDSNQNEEVIDTEKYLKVKKVSNKNATHLIIKDNKSETQPYFGISLPIISSKEIETNSNYATPKGNQLISLGMNSFKISDSYTKQEIFLSPQNLKQAKESQTQQTNLKKYNLLIKRNKDQDLPDNPLTPKCGINKSSLDPLKKNLTQMHFIPMEVKTRNLKKTIHNHKNINKDNTYEQTIDLKQKSMTFSEYYMNTYHPVLTQSNASKKKKQNTLSIKQKPFMTKTELKSLFTIRKYDKENVNAPIKKAKRTLLKE